jgi:Flp pilus assembly protein TadG
MRPSRFAFAAFCREQSGAIAVIFAVTALALFGCIGLAVDYARGQSTQAALQQDLDTTILHVGKEVAANPGDADPQAVADIFFTALHRENHAVAPAKVAIESSTGGHVMGTATAKVQTRFMKLFGLRELNVKVTSEAEVGRHPVEFALVLDNTGSMSGSKLDTLKTASKSLIDTVFQSADAEQYIKVSIVPFANYVNVGQAQRSQSWLDVSSDTAKKSKVCQDEAEPILVPGSCVDQPYSVVIDGQTITGTTPVCQYTAGKISKKCNDVVSGKQWNGCVGSRPSPWDTIDDNYAVRVPGILDVSCPSEITPLTNQKAVASAAIDGMVATGDTYIPAGLMWGWATLSKLAPFDQGDDKAARPDLRKIMVLMTDGYNTLSTTAPYDGTHQGNDTTKSNALTAELCVNIKNAGIELYTVAFEVTDAKVKSILENCASEAANFHDASDATSLERAFEKIAADFYGLRLAR